jgi:predicted RNA-binding protein with TRAM domain
MRGGERVWVKEWEEEKSVEIKIQRVKNVVNKEEVMMIG